MKKVIQKHPLPWRYQFEEAGGDDNETGAFVIIDGEGVAIIAVDGWDFGQARCDYADRKWTPVAEELAKGIVEMANGQEGT